MRLKAAPLAQGKDSGEGGHTSGADKEGPLHSQPGMLSSTHGRRLRVRGVETLAVRGRGRAGRSAALAWAQGGGGLGGIGNTNSAARPLA